jgi:hypothetical protein
LEKADRSWIQGLLAWLSALAAVIFAGLIIAALLPDSGFSTGILIFRGVKAALIIPLILVAMVLFSTEERAAWMQSPLTHQRFIFAIIIFAAIAFMLERSGNGAHSPYELELKIRFWLERAFIARPRFKELLAHPLLLSGIALHLMRHKIASAKRYSRLCLWIGSIGLISVINSFCHLHTPLLITLLRIFNGAWLGLLLSIIPISLLHQIKHER